MCSDQIKRQRFWYLLERKRLGTGTSDELDELDKMAKANQKAYDTIALVDRLWQFRSADQMDEVIRKELADGHEVKYLWPVRIQTPNPNTPMSGIVTLISVNKM